MDSVSATIISRVFLAALLGAAIGFERRHSRKQAGMRTYSLISLGAALFTALSYEGLRDYGATGFDPSRIASQIVVGIGFIGAGIIFLQEQIVYGLTTAAGIWVAAAIGMSVGFGMYSVATAATILTIFILFVIWHFERKVMGITDKDEG